MTKEVADLLRKYADRYENQDFIKGDPSWFMHQVNGSLNQETTAFVAANLSYGSRKQFMPKIQQLIDWADGDMFKWIRDGGFEKHFQPNDLSCFYRLQTKAVMYCFFNTYRTLLTIYGSISQYLKLCMNCDMADRGKNNLDNNEYMACIDAIKYITDFYASNGSSGVVPKDTSSACKRICMFMRWMVRADSPVDLGLWSDFIDRRTLIMPLDTHVLSQAVKLNLMSCRNTSMSAAQKLTALMGTVFPDDPLKGDFALFGYEVANLMH